MKYLYTDRYVGNRSNRDDEFVGNGETERGRERGVVRWCVLAHQGG